MKRQLVFYLNLLFLVGFLAQPFSSHAQSEKGKETKTENETGSESEPEPGSTTTLNSNQSLDWDCVDMFSNAKGLFDQPGLEDGWYYFFTPATIEFSAFPGDLVPITLIIWDVDAKAKLCNGTVGNFEPIPGKPKYKVKFEIEGENATFINGKDGFQIIEPYPKIYFITLVF